MKHKKLGLEVLLVSLLLIFLSSLATARLTLDVDDGGFFPRQSIIGEVLVVPESTEVYTTILDLNHVCRGDIDTTFSWSHATTSAYGTIIKSDFRTQARLKNDAGDMILGAYYATMEYKFPAQTGEISVQVKASCRAGVKFEHMTVRVGTQTKSECNFVGQKRCRDSRTLQACVKSSTGALVWGAISTCDTYEVCEAQTSNTADWCIPTKKDECSFGEARCVSENFWQSCISSGGINLWSATKTVPSGYICQGNEFVKGTPTDLCAGKNCNDNDESTVDTCNAGVCFNSPRCAPNEQFIGKDTISGKGRTGICVVKECSDPGDFPCAGAFFNDYPECSWDTSNCGIVDGTNKGVCALPFKEGFIVNINSCVYETATTCSLDSDCDENQVCESNVCLTKATPDEPFECSGLIINGECKAVSPWVSGGIILGVLIIVFGGIALFWRVKKK